MQARPRADPAYYCRELKTGAREGVFYREGEESTSRPKKKNFSIFGGFGFLVWRKERNWC